MPARQSGSPSQQCIGAISAFVDGIDSHIILRLFHVSTMKVCSEPDIDFAQKKFQTMWTFNINTKLGYRYVDNIAC